MKMLNSFYFLFSLVTFFGIVASNYTQAQTTPTPNNSPSPATTSSKNVATIEDFAKLFAPETKPMPFAVGKVWLLKKPKTEPLPPQLIKQFIANNKIWVNNLKKEAIPTPENFYPIAQVNLHPNFYSLLVADSQGETINVYLLNYSKEGKFADGVCAISVRPVAEGYSRNTILTDGRMIMVKEAKQGTSQLFTFDVWEIGNFQGRL